MSFGHIGDGFHFRRWEWADISGDDTGDIMGNSRARGEPFGELPAAPDL